MPDKFPIARIQGAVRAMFSGPQVLAFVPAICLAAFWLGGEKALMVAAFGVPLASALARRPGNWADGDQATTTHPKGVVANDVFLAELDRLYAAADNSGKNTACFIVALDDMAEVLDQHGQLAADILADQFRNRILCVIRREDIVTQVGTGRFHIGLAPSLQLDLETCIQMAGRIQATIEEPILLNGAGIYASCSIGFCQNTALANASASDWLDAATDALLDAQNAGQSTIRAYSGEIRRRSLVRTNLRQEFQDALHRGQIRPWFQPQLSTDTGQITGFEALARWDHPDKGVLGPQVFLSFAEQANLLGQLGQAIRHHAFKALQAWDQAGANIPRVGVNFSSDELRDPGLIDRLKWELDSFDLNPDRLAVEILETVFSGRPDDIITRNVTALSRLGCCIDLDDFGTGHASIAAIKRFDVSRIKIDRTFVTRSDRDASQQQLVSAILTMAERLNVESLAEGVETPGEHALMAQLGSTHVQGFGIGRPMPFEETLDWIATHRSKLHDAPKIGRGAG